MQKFCVIVCYLKTRVLCVRIELKCSGTSLRACCFQSSILCGCDYSNFSPDQYSCQCLCLFCLLLMNCIKVSSLKCLVHFVHCRLQRIVISRFPQHPIECRNQLLNVQRCSVKTEFIGRQGQNQFLVRSRSRESDTQAGQLLCGCALLVCPSGVPIWSLYKNWTWCQYRIV